MRVSRYSTLLLDRVNINDGSAEASSARRSVQMSLRWNQGDHGNWRSP